MQRTSFKGPFSKFHRKIDEPFSIFQLVSRCCKGPRSAGAGKLRQQGQQQLQQDRRQQQAAQPGLGRQQQH